LPNYGRAEPPADVRDRYESRIRSLTVGIPPDALRSGGNVLAVEIHRSAIPVDLPPFGRGVRDTAGLVDIRLTAPRGGSAVAKMSPSRGLQIRVADPWERIDVDSPSAEDSASVAPLQMVAPKNGFCAGQVVVTSQEPMHNLTATASDLTSNASSISAWAIQARFVQLGKPFLPLLNDPTESATVQPVWLTVNVPADAKPGRYTGRLRIEALGKHREVPLHLAVPRWQVNDPRRWKTVVNLLQSAESVAAWSGVTP
jgi:hypothetical protein